MRANEKRYLTIGALAGAAATGAFAYHFAIRPLCHAAEINAQMGFLLITGRTEKEARRSAV